LFGLFSIVTLLAGQLHQQTRTAVLTDSWYRKSHPTFADALAAVWRQIWRETGLLTSQRQHKTPKHLRPFSDAWFTHSVTPPDWPNSS
jgi:hypothetical protein